MSNVKFTIEDESLVIEHDGGDLELSLDDLLGAMETQSLVSELSLRIRSLRDNEATGVLDAFDDDMIKDQARNRGCFSDAFTEMSDWDAEKLRHAIINDDGRRVVDLLRPLVGRVI